APGINQNLVIIEGENVVNVFEIAENNFDVFPNPATDQLNLQGITQSNVSILDVSGKLIESIAAHQQRIDVSHLAAGVYFVRAQTTQGIQQKKFIKQ
ncbi:MAG: T9SS type A sorting domain-containing protein, partial [Flavobacteriales bacterium]